MNKDTVRITIELTRKNADIVEEFKEEVGVVEGRSKAESIFFNMVLTKLRTPIRNMFKEKEEFIERVEPTTYLNPPNSTPKPETTIEITPGRLEPIQF